MFYILFVFPAAVLLALLTSLPVWYISKRRNGYLYPIRRLALMGFAGTMILILYATVFWSFPFRFTSYHMLNLKPFQWISSPYAMGYSRMMTQLFLNMCMFFPFGVLLPVLYRRMRKLPVTVLTAFAFSLSIETFQYFIGRSADVDDLIMNTLGALAGYCFFALCNCIFAKEGWWRKSLGFEVSREEQVLRRPLFTD